MQRQLVASCTDFQAVTIGSWERWNRHGIALGCFLLFSAVVQTGSPVSPGEASIIIIYIIVLSAGVESFYRSVLAAITTVEVAGIGPSFSA